VGCPSYSAGAAAVRALVRIDPDLAVEHVVRLPAAIRTALEDVSAPYFGYPERRSDR